VKGGKLIYLLCGLLIIHGIVCLVGAFSPVYPPVFFFYAFFPGPFIIKLIIVLLAGAAQLAYGVYLSLRQKRRIRWYWPAIATVVMAGLLLVFPAVQNPDLFTGLGWGNENRQSIPTKAMPPISLPITAEGAPDDVVPTADGPEYRANSEVGIENGLVPIESKEIVLAGNKYSPQVTYRDYIATKAGESGNNILRIDTGGQAINKLSLYTVAKPDEIAVTEGMRWQRIDEAAVVLTIEVLPDVKLGPYIFKIGVKINGTDCGAVPCTVNVIGNASEFPFLGNHGITTTRVEPEPGDNVTMSSALMVKLTLDDLTAKSDVIVIGKVVDIFPSRSGTEPLWSSYLQVFTDVIIETERYLYGEPQSAYIAVRVTGGRAGEIVMWVEDEPVFNLGEEALLFLTRVPQPNFSPEGIVPDDYYRVTGAMQGKLGYLDSQAVNLGGESFTVSEIEQKIGSIRHAEGGN
ncbi:MAG: hypothetical protein PHR56_09155, partial [Dehalococcoidales bacterium]|nr:hypothetical protein [Dehalococcoidales bacterium]